MQPQELAKQIKTRNAPIIVDVRTGFEFNSGHIPGAIHAPTWKDGKLHHEYRQPSDFIAKINREYIQKKAVFREKNDRCLLWLGCEDSNLG